MKLLIDKENNEKKLYNKDENKILQGFLTFDVNKDLELLDKLIIKEYTKNTFYCDLNKWLTNLHFNSYEIVAYFAARLMYSLNKYAKQEGKYYNLDKKELFRGMKLPYSSISGRKDTQSLYKLKKRFSVILFIRNYYKKDWISNGVDIQDVSQYPGEKEIIFLPFSFFLVRDVVIDHINYKADIYLETIGKKEILEEQIKIGKKN